MSDLESIVKLQLDILKGMEGCGTSLPLSTFPGQVNTVSSIQNKSDLEK